MKVSKKQLQAYVLGMNCGQEVQVVAERVINENLYSRFKRFAFYYHGNTDADLKDCLLDFNSFGGELKIEVPKEVHPFKCLQFFGMTPKDSLSSLYYQTLDRPELAEAIEGNSFVIYGRCGIYAYSSTIMHYCFAEGRISIEDALDMMACEA